MPFAINPPRASVRTPQFFDQVIGLVDRFEGLGDVEGPREPAWVADREIFHSRLILEGQSCLRTVELGVIPSERRESAMKRSLSVVFGVVLSLLLLGAGTALLASVIPYTLELTALRRVPRNVFGILLSLEPVAATAIGWLLLHQSAGLVRIAAVTLVVAASIGSSLSAGKASMSDDDGHLESVNSPEPVRG